MKTTNKKIIFSLLFLGILCFTSCNEEEFLGRTPTDAISVDAATSSTENLALILNGIARGFYLRIDNQGRVGVQTLMLNNEVLGDDYVMNARANGFYTNTGQWQTHINPDFANTDFPYRLPYRFITNSNTVINGVENATGSQEEKDALQGEALIYRAWSHLTLVQFYGARYVAGGNNSQLGVPIILNAEQAASSPPRNTVEEVYAQVHADLDQAITLLSGQPRKGRGNGSNPGIAVAQGLQARAYLTQGNYPMAAQFAVAARDGFSLMGFDDYFNNFTDLSSNEWIWGSTIETLDQSDVFGNYGAFISRNFSSSNIRGNPKSIRNTLFDQISTTDVRHRLFSPSGLHNEFGLPPGVVISNRHQLFPYTNQKFIAEATGDSRMDQPYMRISEMYLIEAEALARMGQDGPAAQALLPMAQARDPQYTLSTNSGQALIDEILLQRRIELWGEGFRFFDLKRLDMPLNRDFANTNFNPTQSVIEFVPAGDLRWQWQIPTRAIDTNPSLIPNPL